MNEKIAYRDLYKLPNGFEIFQINKIETNFLYKEIFVEENYLKNGIQINEGAVVFDVGANIGLFSLFIASKCKEFTIYAFEPLPPTYEILKLNTERYGEKIRVINSGLSDQCGETQFVFYPGMSVFSGQFADAEEDSDLLRNIMLNQYKDKITDEKLLNKMVGHFMENRFAKEVYRCKIDTISHIITEYTIERIDLLKIDVEKAERYVLDGIKDGDWDKIDQIVMEVHEANIPFLDDLKSLLVSRRYQVVVEKEESFTNNNIYNFYARRG